MCTLCTRTYTGSGGEGKENMGDGERGWNLRSSYTHHMESLFTFGKSKGGGGGGGGEEGESLTHASDAPC